MPETSKGGSRIYRHDAPNREQRAVTHVEPEVERSLAEHYAKFFKTEPSVLHELVSDEIHLDVYFYPPAELPFTVAATVGMSALPMQTPQSQADQRWAELMIALPADWPLNEAALQKEQFSWPIDWLKRLARLPHLLDAWFGEFHTIPNGDPPTPIAKTDFVGFALLPPVSFGDGCGTIDQPDRARTTRLLSLVPLHRDEMQFKLDHGMGELLELFDAQNVNDLLRPDRPSVLPRRGIRKLFQKR